MTSMFMSSHWECGMQWSQHLTAERVNILCGMYFLQNNYVDFVISSLKDSLSSHC